MGSATTLDLHGDYDDFDVTINNLTDAQTILYTGDGLDDLFLHDTPVIGTDNLTMSGGHTIDTLHTHVGFGLNLVSIGGGHNIINNVDDVNGNVLITGDTDRRSATSAVPTTANLRSGRPHQRDCRAFPVHR